MSIISYPTEPASRAVKLRFRSSKPGLFSLIVAALHASRRRQARQILRRHAFLIAPDTQRSSCESRQNGGEK